MMNSIQKFNFENGKETRVIMKDGEPWFVAKDICDVLGYSNGPAAVEKHCKHSEIISIPNRDGIRGNPNVTIIPESDVYRLIIRSHLPAAEKFEAWLMEEVLPSIRKHGAYMTDERIKQTLLDSDTIIEIATQLKQEREKRLSLEAKAEEDRPKVEFAEAVSESPDTISVGELAKLINNSGVSMGRDRLFKQLREDGFIMQYDCVPTQKAVALGVLKTIERVCRDSRGVRRLNVSARVTSKGQRYFVGRYGVVS